MCHLKLQILYRILCALDEINCGTNDAIAFNIIYHTQISALDMLTRFVETWDSWSLFIATYSFPA